jgi:alpha-ketoglutarate-dependent 2,4-dichlorophenoxyacetate dioxygenase
VLFLGDLMNPMVESLPQTCTTAARPAAPTGERTDAVCIGPRLSPAGGVAIDGLDLSQPMSPAVTEQILAAFRQHHIIVFHNQTLNREQQFAFSAHFGEVERHAARQSKHKRYGVAHVISNLGGDGNPVDRSASPVSNYRWHTDKSYYRQPPMMTTLYAVELPPQGGDTEFANTAMAYSALTEAVRQRIAGLRVVFWWGAGRRSGDPSLPELEIPEPVDHPLVRTHPDTGDKALYLGNHASHILNLPPEEGGALLDELLMHATQRKFVYVHRWRIGDLVIWDNRCLLHRAVSNFAMDKYRRVLHRTVVKGTVPF